LERPSSTNDFSTKFERSALHVACAQAMRDQPSGQRPGSSRAPARRAGTNPLAECARDHSRTWAAARRAETSCWSGLRESSAGRSLPHLPCHHALVARLAIAALARVDHLEIASQGVRLQANRWPKEHGDRPRPSIVSTRLKRIGGQATEDSQDTPTPILCGEGSLGTMSCYTCGVRPAPRQSGRLHATPAVRP
jgi:hypothetical protein